MIPVQTQTSLCGDTINLHQLVRTPDSDANSQYIVVGCNEGSIEIIDCEFEGEREEVSAIEWQVDEYEAVSVSDGIPVFAY